ncbi:MAG: magnesium transporter [Spirochaetota bacterium]|nr:magnesium transporter [Spirochaetota bacterium]
MEDREIKKLAVDIIDLVESDKTDLIKNIINALHFADLTEILYYLSEENRLYVFKLLDAEIASQVISELDDNIREQLLDELDIKRISEIADEMDSDDATDLVSNLSNEEATLVLADMDKEDSAEVKELLAHDEETAGGIMAKEFISIEQNRTAEEAINEIRNKAEEVKYVYYVFVVDEKGVLLGFISLKRLILADQKKKLSLIMNRDVISVKTTLDQEEVANIVKKYDLISVPVVDEKGVLVGRITIDDIMDVIDEEVSEDIQKMAGISEEEVSETSPLKISRVRLPWLIAGLVGGTIAALIISRFENSLRTMISLEKIIILSFFTPVIMSTGGNVGIQSSTIIVRGLATGDISFFDAYKHLYKEIKVAIINGLACSLIIFSVAYVWKNINLALLLGGSLFLIMNIAAFVGALIPLILKKLNLDPAVATGPFITISNDIIGLIIYFSLSILLIS